MSKISRKAQSTDCQETACAACHRTLKDHRFQVLWGPSHRMRRIDNTNDYYCPMCFRDWQAYRRNYS